MYAKILDSCVFLNNFNVMQQKNYKVIGVMSGTSLDGVDLAFVRITNNGTTESIEMPKFTAEIIVAETTPYTPLWISTLKEAVAYPPEELKNLNIKYTAYLAKVINEFIARHQLIEIDAICSHGHTILHQPEKGYTLQIGNLSEIAHRTGEKVVCDFRVQDVQLGGQGAPLVPIGDELLFGNYNYCLNLGGFANVSTQKDGKRIAYDICAVNTVLNVYAQKLGRMYDDKGVLAQSGIVHIPLLEQLNKLSFFKQLPPKSLGIEWVHSQLFPLIDSFNLTPADVLATFAEHIAIQVTAQFEGGSTVLVTGGGTYNTYLLDRMHFCLKTIHFHKNVSFVIPEKELIEFKEALIFGLLGVLKLEGQINCLSSVTGASYDHSSGYVYLP